MVLRSLLGLLSGSAPETSEVGEFELRLDDALIGDSNDLPVKEIKGRGAFPINQSVSNAAFITSLFDVTDEETKPVFTPIDRFQEPDTVAFSFQQEIGDASPSQYLPDWTPIGVVIPEILHTPRGGQRKIKAVVRLVSLDTSPDIQYGFGDGALWAGVIDFDFLATEKGYEEESEHRDESRALTVKLAMGVAMSDGAIADSEGEVLKQWVRGEIEGYDEDESKRLKHLYNTAMSDAYNAATQGSLEIDPLVSRLKEVAEKNFKLEAIDLCYRVMNADGNIDKAELVVLQKITRNIGLSPNEIETVRDRNLIDFKGASTSDADPETLIGIDPSWSSIEKKAFLQKEFNKWNGRLNNLPEEAQRAQAQLMLDRIGALIKRYD